MLKAHAEHRGCYVGKGNGRGRKLSLCLEAAGVVSCAYFKVYCSLRMTRSKYVSGRKGYYFVYKKEKEEEQSEEGAEVKMSIKCSTDF